MTFTLVLAQALGQPHIIHQAIHQVDEITYDYGDFLLFALTDSSIGIDHKIQLFDELVSKSRKKHHDDTIYWIEKVFYMIQRKELKEYENYVDFNKTLSEKKYDCVTGTALVSLVLSQLNIPHQIIEFPYHVTISMIIDDQRIMIESTDPIYGFVKNQEEYKDRVEFYLYSDEFPDTYMEVISIKELAGLHYYNLAYAHFSKGEYNDAFTKITKAEELYPCGRIQSLRFQILTEMSHPVVTN